MRQVLCCQVDDYDDMLQPTIVDTDDVGESSYTSFCGLGGNKSNTYQ